MQMIFRKIIILGLLLGCVWVFGLSDGSVVQISGAAGCIQDCEASEAMCRDYCSASCSVSDAACTSCHSTCNTEFRSCMRTAEWCEGGDGYYTAQCQWEYAQHCPIISGQVDCDHPSAHEGWYQVCNHTGGMQCVSCPISEWCNVPSTPGLPSCY